METFRKAGLLLGLFMALSLRAGPSTVYGDDKIPEFTLTPPPFSEGIFPCSDCHADMEVNLNRRQLTEEHTEISESFNHASDQQWCINCHNPGDRDKLRLANGKLISFDESQLLCGQCHGTIYRDWKVGVHGKRTGEWNGKKLYRLCVNCHNPHTPRFKKITPLPPPTRPDEYENRRLTKSQIPRNPIGDLK